jgi:hypothetical protein
VLQIGGNASKIKEVIFDGTNFYVSGDGAFNTAVVLKMTSSYSVIWQKNLSNKTPLNDIALNSNNCMVVAGSFNFNETLDSYNLVLPSGMSSSTSNSFFAYLCGVTLGLPENNDDFSSVKVFPNPSNGNFTIQMDRNLIGSKVSIYSMLGKKIREFRIETTNLNQNMNKGMYLIEIQKENQKLVKKLIIN